MSVTKAQSFINQSIRHSLTVLFYYLIHYLQSQQMAGLPKLPGLSFSDPTVRNQDTKHFF